MTESINRPQPSFEQLSEIFPDLPSDIDLAVFQLDAVPSHLAVIMDGNGRWAKQRGLGRAQGHSAGIKAVRELIRTANDLGIGYLTIYSFSTENWARPKTEVQALMRLFARTLAVELEPLHEEGVRIQTIGDLSTLPTATRQVFDQAQAKTVMNTGMTLIIAVNYGGRQEILAAAQSMARAALAGQISPTEIEDLTTEGFANWLATASIPDPDLLIRTSGEFRISNFLLYQLAYSEFYISQVLWPDFDRYELLRALIAYQNRQRRFGKL